MTQERKEKKSAAIICRGDPWGAKMTRRFFYIITIFSKEDIVLIVLITLLVIRLILIFIKHTYICTLINSRIMNLIKMF
jgi:hypothetical protein